MTLQWDKGDKTTGCRRLELQAPTVLPAGLKFIFTPPPRHQSNAASAAGPDCKRAFFCVQHTIRLSCYCQRKATRSSQKHQCLSKEQTPDIRGTGSGCNQRLLGLGHQDDHSNTILTVCPRGGPGPMVTAEHPHVAQTAVIPTVQPEGFADEASRVTRGLSLRPRTRLGQASSAEGWPLQQSLSVRIALLCGPWESSIPRLLRSWLMLSLWMFNLWATWYYFGELWNLKIKISQTFEL